MRSPNLGQEVNYIDYQGYESMMYTQMKLIANKLRLDLDVGSIVVAHRLGKLKPGDASIAIFISAVHSREALSACQTCLEQCKKLLPVWKYEVGHIHAKWL